MSTAEFTNEILPHLPTLRDFARRLGESLGRLGLPAIKGRPFREKPVPWPAVVESPAGHPESRDFKNNPKSPRLGGLIG